MKYPNIKLLQAFLYVKKNISQNALFDMPTAMEYSTFNWYYQIIQPAPMCALIYLYLYYLHRPYHICICFLDHLHEYVFNVVQKVKAEASLDAYT